MAENPVKDFTITAHNSMKCIIQRVTSASISVDNEVVASIDTGILALVGFALNDDASVNTWLTDKLLGMRLFSDEQEKMNLSVKDVSGSILLVSNFTLCANTEKGLRPSFANAEIPSKANTMFDDLYKLLSMRHDRVAKGIFGAHMKISLLNDGPVTLILER